jgi:hypothetical protein
MAPEALEHAVAQQLHALDPRLPLSEVEAMSEYLDDMTAAKRFTSVVLASFAIGLLGDSRSKNDLYVNFFLHRLIY